MSQKARNIVYVVGILVVLAILGVAFRFPIPKIEAGPVTVFTVNLGGVEFPVSNSLIITWTAMVLLIVLSFAATRKMELVPSGTQNLMEAIIEALNNLVTDVAGERGSRFFPYVATIFLFVLFANTLGLVPGFGSIGIWHEVVDEAGHAERELFPIFRAPSADLNLTFSLAIVSVLMTQVFGVGAAAYYQRYRVKNIKNEPLRLGVNLFWGIIGYFSRFINLGKWIDFVKALLGLRPRKGMGGLLIWGFMDVFMGIIELFSEVMKILSFSFRLWGNIFAGEVLLIVMAYLFAQILPLPFYFLELFVSFIQAFVFAILTLMFMTMATMPHGGPEHPELEPAH